MKGMGVSDKERKEVKLSELNSEGTLNIFRSNSLRNYSTQQIRTKILHFLTRTLILMVIFFGSKWIL